MEFVEILTDLYFALGSAISSVSDRVKNYHKIISIAKDGDSSTYAFLKSIDVLKDTICHEPKAKMLLVDQINNKGGYVNIHCVLLDGRAKYVNSLTIKHNTSSIPIDLFELPQKWDI